MADRLFWPAAWLFLGAGAIMFLAALRYQWRVWWPFRREETAGEDEEDLRTSWGRRWADRLRRRRLRRARRVEDLAQEETRRRRWQAIRQVRQAITLARIAQGIAVLVTFLALLAAFQLPTDATTATLWSWEPAGDLHVGLVYRVDDLGRWLAQITLAVTFLVFIARGSSRTADYAWGLVALGAFVNAVFCLDLVAFLFSWVLLDVALFAALAGAATEKDTGLLTVSLAASAVVTVALLWAILMVGRFEGALLFTRASPILLESRVLGMFLLAAVFRLTLYPFHLRFYHAAQASAPLAALGHVLPLMAGFYLLARLYALASGGMPGLGGVQVLGVLSLVAGAVLIWRSTDPRKQLSLAFLSQTGALVMVLTQGTSEAITATLVGLVSLVLAAGALFMQVDRPAPSCLPWRTVQGFGRVLLVVPLASLAGVPPLLGFWGWWMGYNVFLESNQPGMFLLALGCQISVLVALLRSLDRLIRQETTVSSLALAGKPPEGGRWAVSESIRWAAMGLLSLPLLLLGLWPPATLAAWRATVALVAGVPEPVLSVLALSPTADALTPWLTLGGLLLSLGAILVLSGWLRLPRVGWTPEAPQGQPRTVRRLYEALNLAWAYRLGWGLFVRVGELLAGLGSALDGQYALAWVVLLGFAIGLFLLGGGVLP